MHNDFLISKALLLSKRTEEEFFAMYLGINPKLNKLYKSPLRGDKKPTCSFHRSKSGLKFKDFGINKSYSFIDVVMERYNLSYYKALRFIAKDIGLIDDVIHIPTKPLVKYDNSKIESTNKCLLEVTIKDFSKEELEWWKTYNITLDILKEFNVFSLKAVFINKKLSSISSKKQPIYGYFFGKENGLDLWKIYFPFREKYRFLLNNSIIQGFKQIQGVYGDFIIITKSYKDVISMRSFGIYAIAPQSESVILDEELVAYLKDHFKHIIFNADWDRTGKLFMINNRRKYGGLCLTFSNRDFWEKDFSDNVAKFGPEKIKILINFLKKKYIKDETNSRIAYVD